MFIQTGTIGYSANQVYWCPQKKALVLKDWIDETGIRHRTSLMLLSRNFIKKVVDGQPISDISNYIASLDIWSWEHMMPASKLGLKMLVSYVNEYCIFGSTHMITDNIGYDILDGCSKDKFVSLLNNTNIPSILRAGGGNQDLEIPLIDADKIIITGKHLGVWETTDIMTCPSPISAYYCGHLRVTIYV